ALMVAFSGKDRRNDIAAGHPAGATSGAAIGPPPGKLDQAVALPRNDKFLAGDMQIDVFFIRSCIGQARDNAAGEIIDVASCQALLTLDKGEKGAVLPPE